MAKSGGFTYTNTTATTHKTISLYDLKELENYGSNGGDGIRSYTNTQASSNDAPERFSFFSSVKKNVGTSLPVAYPSPRRVAASDKNSSVTEGVKYGIKYEAIHTTVDSNDATYRVDRPFVGELSFCHEVVDTLTVSQVMDVLGRMYSFLEKEDGSSRIADLMGGIININAD
jgi:hypothetical protein